jgi:hypothetical protein
MSSSRLACSVAPDGRCGLQIIELSFEKIRTMLQFNEGADAWQGRESARGRVLARLPATAAAPSRNSA